MPTTLLPPWIELGRNADSIDRFALDLLTLSVNHSHDECWLEYCFAREQRNWLVYDQPRSVRFLVSGGRRHVTIAPRLADRAVVSRPFVSTGLLPQESTTLIVGTPLWAEVRMGDRALTELPTSRPSDTWFGADTRNGELCYATQTRARLNLDAVERSAFQALTAVTVINRGGDNLSLDRINVPVPHLTLYCDGSRFWTSSLTITREKDLTTAKLTIEGKPPKADGKLERIADPRTPIRGGVLNKTIDLLFA